MKVDRLALACGAAAVFALSGIASAKPPQWEAAPVAQRARPIRMAKFTKVDGRIVLTSPWVETGADPVSMDTTIEPAFDCYEGDPNSLPGFNTPSGFMTCGANATLVPNGQPATRWYGGATWIQPRTFNDMTVANGFAGADATRVSWAWFQPPTPTNIFIAIGTYEDYGSACTFPATPGFIDGVIFEFGFVVQNSAFFADEDLTFGPTPLTLGLPMDGSGAYDIEFYADQGGTTLITAPGIQPFYWGTGEDEPTPDGRAGTQAPTEFDDDVVPYGPPYANGAAPAGECYEPAPAAGGCPASLGAMMEFWAKGTACYADCNNSGTLTIADFGCFQAAFAGNDPYADCNNSGTLTIADFGCFQAAFAGGCP